MKDILNKMKQLNKKTYLIICVLLVAILLLLINSKTIINRIRENFEKEELVEFEYKTYEVSGNIGITVITIRNKEGIEKVTYLEEDTNKPLEIIARGKTQIAFDYKMEDFKQYEVKAEFSNGEKKTYTIDYEIPRIKGNYTLVKGVYVNEPDVSAGFVKENTRYLYQDSNGNLIPGNWITDAAPNDWYSYNDSQWANIYVENNGLESYYVWIPRYVYKLDQTTQRSDIKFINTYNEYIDGATGDKLTWEDLKAQGYQLPEAFTWKNKEGADLITPGYWISKYQLSELSSYKLDYNLTASKTAFNVSNFTNNVSTEAASYTYAINGQIVNTSGTLDDYSFINGTPDQTNTINVTALNSNGEIIASMTKKLELTEVNPPDVTGFNPNTTFYVYWDENGNEHNEIPINMEPPEDWYNYTYSNWANIVSRNNGLETYLVWIPRYQYNLDQTSQRSNIKFIKGTGTETDTGYQIPEAFTWNGKELTGYWISKYQLTEEETTARVTADISIGATSINVQEITGSYITDAINNNVNFKIEYYLDGIKKYEGTSLTENYVYTGLNLNTKYTVNIIVRNKDTDEYIGAITKEVTTIAANEPDLTGFDTATTYYVLYDSDGNETQRISIDNTAPDGWYDYATKRWANIVTTANNTESYFVWIPRYEYKLNSVKQKSDINFISTDITNSNCTQGYQVPEAFTWNGKELPGYWISKYQLTE